MLELPSPPLKCITLELQLRLGRCRGRRLFFWSVRRTVFRFDDFFQPVPDLNLDHNFPWHLSSSFSSLVEFLLTPSFLKPVIIWRRSTMDVHKAVYKVYVVEMIKSGVRGNKTTGVWLQSHMMGEDHRGPSYSGVLGWQTLYKMREKWSLCAVVKCVFAVGKYGRF